MITIFTSSVNLCKKGDAFSMEVQQRRLLARYEDTINVNCLRFLNSGNLGNL